MEKSLYLRIEYQWYISRVLYQVTDREYFITFCSKMILSLVIFINTRSVYVSCAGRKKKASHTAHPHIDAILKMQAEFDV